jgi:hypothetical protein
MIDHGIGLRSGLRDGFRKGLGRMHFIPTYGSNGERTGSLNVTNVVALSINEPREKEWEVMAETQSGLVIRVSEIIYHSRELAVQQIDFMTKRW